MKEFVNELEAVFKESTNPKVALQQKAYMRGQFEFYGLTATKRRELTKPFLAKDFLPEKKELVSLIKELWQKPEREYQMFSMDLSMKYLKQIEESDIDLFEYMVLNKSWWDTVDMVASNLMGAYFKQFPEKKILKVDEWLASGNIWLQRSTLLFQLKYKERLDTEMLTYCINFLLGSKEFFINKAIGWVLRQYSRTNPEWVLDFVERTDLSPLSRREALRLLK